MRVDVHGSLMSQHACEGAAESHREGDGRIAAAACRASDVPDLVARVIDALGAPDLCARLWRTDAGLPVEVVRQPTVPLPSCDPAEIATALRLGRPKPHDDHDLVPLIFDNEAVGVLELVPGGRADLATLESAAPAIAARLVALRDSGRQLERLPYVLETNGAFAIQQVIAEWAVHAKQMLDHDRLSIYLLTTDRTALERFAVATSPIIPGEGEVQPLEDVGLKRVIQMNEPLVSPDFGTDERIPGREDAIIARAGYHGLVSVPLRMDGEPFGILNFVSRVPGFYCDEDIAIAQQIADSVAVFLQNLRLQHALRLAATREAVDQERKRVASEFHDTLAQELAEISLTAELWASENPADPGLAAHAIADIARRAGVEVRRFIRDMLPPELEQRPLSEAIAIAAGQWRSRSGIDIELDLAADGPRLPQPVETAAYRIFQEALNNVRKHASASLVRITLRIDAERLQLRIQDDGDGFRTAPFSDPPSGLGLQGMRDRAHSVGGRLVVTSSGGGGTELLLHVPIGSDPQQAHGCGKTIQRMRRIVVVDDHPAFLAGIGELLGSSGGLRVVGRATSGAEAIALVQRLRPDLVLLDLDLPDISGVETVSRIATTCPETAVVMMSAFAHSDNVAAALTAGARGFIEKSSPHATVVDALRAALDGTTVVSTANRTGAEPKSENLSPRETHVLRLVASGQTNSEIAHSLHFSEKTVERIVSNVVTKLRARNRTHAVVKATEQKLIDIRSM